MAKPGWRWVQGLIGAVILIFLARNVLDSWRKASAVSVPWEFHWQYLIASLLVTWAMYALLIWGWRIVLIGWGQSIRALNAARIWTISSLGKYIPFKIWTIVGMAMMAEKAGVSGAAAIGSAVVMQLLAIATGAILGMSLMGTRVLGQGIGPVLAMAVTACAIAGVGSLASSTITGWIGRVIGRPGAVLAVRPLALAGSLVANLISWCGYGAAFLLLIAGTMPSVHLDWSAAIGAFAISYLVGFLNPFLPGGLGGREIALITVLNPLIGFGPATALAMASRLTLTINELGAAVPFLLWRKGGVADAA